LPGRRKMSSPSRAIPAEPRPEVPSASAGGLAARLEQAEATIRALSTGEVDAVVVNGPNGPQVYTLEGADHPYRVLVEQMHEATVTLDSDLVILYSNPQFGKIVGTAADSVTGSPFHRFLSPGDLRIVTALAGATELHGHATGEFSVTDIHGSRIPVSVSVTMMDVAGMRSMCLVATDLRAQRRNEAIVKEEQLSRLILDQAGEAIVVIDPNGVIVRASESARQLAGGPILSTHFDQAFTLDAPGAVMGSSLNAARIFDAASQTRISGLEGELTRRDGKHRSVLCSASPLWDGADELVGCVITLTDITDRKHAEQTLVRQAEELVHANSDLRQFAHSASHDLREPLRQLAVFNELLQQKYQSQLNPEAAALIQHSIEAAHRMEALLKGLLEYTQAADASRDGGGPVDANEIAEKTLAMFELQIQEAGATVECGVLPRLRVREVHLTQLFQNLIGNALKYRKDEPPVIRVAAEADSANGMWRISVTDNGIGIEPDYREQIFGLFQRLHGGGKYAGSGIGLAICQTIVQRYGGRIWVESEPGRGSKFTFMLPSSTSLRRP
jgi:PAS domain S-box-containing protein